MYEKIKKALYRDKNFVLEHVEKDVICLASYHRAVRLRGKHDKEPTNLPGIKKLFREPAHCRVKVPRIALLNMFDIAKKECDAVAVIVKDRRITLLPKSPKSDLVTASYEVDTNIVTDFCVNPKYFAQILKWSKSDEVTIGVGAPKKPIRIECEFTALIAQKG
ncbi:hypothetical protein NHG32_02510 [Aerococcaceae bacterium NML191219]|nr:hypothetical protein [Aerococcaceae bacterium NML191219]